jgi:signal transduction histidine kinase
MTSYNTHNGDKCDACLEVFLTNWGHGLSNNTDNIRKNIETVRRKLRSYPEIVKLISSELHLIESDLQEIEKIDTPFHTSLINLNQFIRSRKAKWQERALDKGLPNLEIVLNLCEENPSIPSNATWLRRLLDNLVINSLEAIIKQAQTNGNGKDLAQKMIVMQTEITVDGVILTIQDNGPGMPSHLPSSPSQNGHGRGLIIAKQLVKIYQGELQIDPVAPQGTTITIRLPL